MNAISSIMGCQRSMSDNTNACDRGISGIEGLLQEGRNYSKIRKSGMEEGANIQTCSKKVSQE